MMISTADNSLDFLKLVAHEVRWQILLTLSRGDYRVHELVDRLNRPMNLISYHLKQLRESALVKERRSSADGRDVYYALDLEQVQRLYAKAGEEIHPGLGESPETASRSLPNDHQPVRVLFLCTHNSARSQMAEALLRHLGGSRVEVFSAGTEPSRVHPLALRVLEEQQIDTGVLSSKHMSEFVGQSFDFVITVCDQAREQCPLFPGDPERIHWSFPDPSAVEGSEDERYAAFRKIAGELVSRLNYLLLIVDRIHSGH